MKYRKKPIVIEAIQWKGENEVEVYRFLSGIKDFCGSVPQHGTYFYIDYNQTGYGNGGLFIKTLEGDMLARKGDYIIKGVNGEFYPCKMDIFKKTYDEVEE